MRTICEVGVNTPRNSIVLNKHKNELEIFDRVILVEPNFACMTLLVDYIDDQMRNNIPDVDIQLFDCAVAENVGQRVLVHNVKFEHDQYAYLLNTNSPHKHLTKYNEFLPERMKKDAVRSITFDQIDDGYIDELYIDCEGSEWWVLKNLRSTPSKIQIEMFKEKENIPNYINPYYKEIMQWMIDYDYIISNVNQPNYTFIKDTEREKS